MTTTTRRRRHPAQASRVLAAGLATASMFGLGAVMAVSGPYPEPSSGAVVVEAAPQTVVIRRVVQDGRVTLQTRPATPSTAQATPQPRSRTRGS